MKILITILSIMLFDFNGYVLMHIDEEISCPPISTKYGIVIEQIYEGYSEENDLYLVEYSNGDIYEIESDDLNEGNVVLSMFFYDMEIRTIYKGSTQETAFGQIGIDIGDHPSYIEIGG